MLTSHEPHRVAHARNNDPEPTHLRKTLTQVACRTGLSSITSAVLERTVDEKGVRTVDIRDAGYSLVVGNLVEVRAIGIVVASARVVVGTVALYWHRLVSIARVVVIGVEAVVRVGVCAV